jgi:hypothetical protein
MSRIASLKRPLLDGVCRGDLHGEVRCILGASRSGVQELDLGGVDLEIGTRFSILGKPDRRSALLRSFGLASGDPASHQDAASLVQVFVTG